MRVLRQYAKDQLVAVYRRMADEVRYRPAAPSDGFGNITAPLDDLDLDAEANRYAEKWWAEEEGMTFFIGYPDGRARPAQVLAIEAARLMCSGSLGAPTALRCLKLAAEEMERGYELKKKRRAVPEGTFKLIRKLRPTIKGTSSLSGRQAVELACALRDGHQRCYLCGESPLEYEFDHVVPLAKGGADHIDNIKLACAECNRQKGTRTPLQLIADSTSKAFARRREVDPGHMTPLP